MQNNIRADVFDGICPFCVEYICRILYFISIYCSIPIGKHPKYSDNFIKLSGAWHQNICAIIWQLSDNYEVLSIVDEDEEERSQLYESYLIRRDEEAKRVIDIIEKTVQSMIKKPYTNSSKKRNKTIRTTEYICRYVN